MNQSKSTKPKFKRIRSTRDLSLETIKTPNQLTKSLSKEEEEFAKNLQDRNWRLSNLYYIKDKHGNKILFRPNWAQKILLEDLWFFTIILKARQIGITTLMCIFYLDQVLFSEYTTAGIIAHKDKDAKKIFKDKVKFAWDNLMPELKDVLGPPNSDSAGELSFPNGSMIFVSTSTRSGTVQFLHISEFGYICAHYPGKAQEIVTGSINSVEKGSLVTIESTAEGKGGYFYDFCMKAQKMMLERHKLSIMDFRFFFFPWWKNPEYTLESKASISTEFREYFKMLEENHDIKLLSGQKHWYIAKKALNRDNMLSEYPSTPEEAFQASIEGAYYAREMTKVYKDKRISEYKYDPNLQVDTWWDLGMNDKNVTVFTQTFGNEIRLIDYYENSGEGLAHYVKMLQDRGYVYGSHVFPHDIKVKELGTGVSRYQTLMNLGLKNLRTVERTKSIIDDIEAVRQLFPRFHFLRSTTAKLVEAAENYRKEWNEKTSEFASYPRHDKYSHAMDAMRTLARGWIHHGIDSGGDGGGEDSSQDFF